MKKTEKIEVSGCEECPCCGQHPYDGSPVCLIHCGTGEAEIARLGFAPDECPLRTCDYLIVMSSNVRDTKD
jgi:hypothetical protein